MSKEIQHPKGIAKLCYATTFHSDLALLLLERKSVSLQQMSSDAQEVQDNLRASGKFSEKIEEEELDIKEQ
jgi:hypothetical protein